MLLHVKTFHQWFISYCHETETYLPYCCFTFYGETVLTKDVYMSSMYYQKEFQNQLAQLLVLSHKFTKYKDG